MLKLVQLLALAAVVAIAASTPVSHLFKDDKVDMALEDLEVLADALEKETSAAADVNPLKPPCTGCTTPMTQSASETAPTAVGVSSGVDAAGCCPRGQYGDFTLRQCYLCNTGETSVVGEITCQNTARTACFKCDACNVLSSDMRCRKKCTAQTKPDCSLTATKDRSGKNIQAGACYKK
jgi:hypothetical protein